MFKTPLFSSFTIGLAAFLLSGALPDRASAQMDMSARERVLDYVARQDPVTAPQVTPAPAAKVIAPDVIMEDTIAPESEIITPQTVQPITEAAVDLEAEKNENEITAAAPTIIPSIPDEALSPKEQEDSIVRDFTTVSRVNDKEGPESFGFFTTAQKYLDQRGQTPEPRLTLRYDVSRKNAKTAVPGPSTTVDIIIGTDYAAISKSADELIIYDFKEKRLLNVSTTKNSFTNASLYAAAYRNLDTVGKMTDGGKKRTLPLGQGMTLDAFYLESALGYAAGTTPPALNIVQSGEKITADFDGERVFSAALNGPELKDHRQAYSFIGLLYHSEPVHPAILAELKDVGAAPNAMTFHSFGPKIPDGEIISWNLKSKMAETAGFPLPASIKSVTELESVSPLGFVISEAITGRALGGQVEPVSALTVIKQQIALGDPLSAWVSAQSLKDTLGGCEQLSGLCKAISKAEAAQTDNPELAQLIEALSQINNKSTRTQGLSALKPMISAADAPSLVLRRAGLALAKTSKAEREAADLSEFDPAQLLSQAIARNPYDLLAYQGLARLQAVRGDFIQSWDINDALRAFPDVAQRLRGPIDRAEGQLTTRAPGFFPPVDP